MVGGFPAGSRQQTEGPMTVVVASSNVSGSERKRGGRAKAPDINVVAGGGAGADPAAPSSAVPPAGASRPPAKSARQTLQIGIRRCEPDSPWTAERFTHLVRRPLSAPQLAAISDLAQDMAIFAPQPLNALYAQWKGGSLMRRPKDIALSQTFGEVLYSLVADVAPALVVEAGTGFGVSGSFIAAALSNRSRGQLVSFEIGDYWHVAERNILKFYHKVRVINDNFENISNHIRASEPIDFAFIDALHDTEVIERQVRHIFGFMRKDGVIVIDDVFNEGAATPALQHLAADRRVSFAATLGTRQLVLVVR